jgi:hypothetical protein
MRTAAAYLFSDLKPRVLSQPEHQEAIMPTDKCTRIILTMIACSLLALVVHNAMEPSETQGAPSETASSNTTSSNTAPSNRQARVFQKLHLCNSRGCIEIEPCDRRHQPFSGDCADVTGDRPTTTPP